MTDEFYLIAITALLPLTAVMLVLQVNPYQALVMRGILGAIAALVYALFGAADVALTEALVGTMLSITLYAVAVRSSMEMRLGWVQPSALDIKADLEFSASLAETDLKAAPEKLDATLVTALQKALKPEHLRLEILVYPSLEALEIALQNKHIHSAVLPDAAVAVGDEDGIPKNKCYRLQTRVKRLHEILESRLPPSFAAVDYFDLVQSSAVSSSDLVAQPSLSHPAQESS